MDRIAPRVSSWHSISLRSLALYSLVLLCLVPCTVVAVKMVHAEKQRAAVERIENLGGLVWYDYQFDAQGNEISYAEPPGPPWLRRIFGDDFVANVTRLRVRDYTDSMLVDLEGMGQLQWLDLTESEVGDAGLVHLGGLMQLQNLNLRATNITDAGLEHLRGLYKLQVLAVDQTSITNAGLEQIGELPHIQTLSVRGTQVTDDGVNRFQAVRPNCTVNR